MRKRFVNALHISHSTRTSSYPTHHPFSNSNPKHSSPFTGYLSPSSLEKDINKSTTSSQAFFPYDLMNTNLPLLTIPSKPMGSKQVAQARDSPVLPPPPDTSIAHPPGITLASSTRIKIDLASDPLQRSRHRLNSSSTETGGLGGLGTGCQDSGALVWVFGYIWAMVGCADGLCVGDGDALGRVRVLV